MDIGLVEMVIYFMGQGKVEFFLKYVQKETLSLLQFSSKEYYCTVKKNNHFYFEQFTFILFKMFKGNV